MNKEHVNSSSIMDEVPCKVEVVVGEAQLNMGELNQVACGSVIELNKMAGVPLDIKANGKVVAKGEMVVVNDLYGIRVTEVV